MAINVREITSTRNTGPLVHDLFSLAVPLVQGEPSQLVAVPGIVVNDPEFVAAYHYGAECYFDQVLDEETERKTCEISDQDVMQFIAETMTDDPRAVRLWGATSLAWKAGIIAGYLSARIQSKLPLYGNCGHCRGPRCMCGGCKSCGLCDCQAHC